MRFFNYDLITHQISLDQPEILLVKEFSVLLDEKRNKSKEDPKGTQKKRAFKELMYIYLMYDWQSPYSEYDDHERRNAAINDAGLTENDITSDDVVSAINKYKEIQNSDRSIRLIRAAQNKADQIIQYFESGSDLLERDDNGKPIFKAKDVMDELSKVGNIIDNLDDLEVRIRKKQKAESSLRGGATEGFVDMYDE